MVVKVVVECALVLKKKKEDDCDEINCRRRCLLSSLSSSSRKLRVESKRTKKKRWVRENFYMIKGSTFVRSLQTNMFKR